MKVAELKKYAKTVKIALKDLKSREQLVAAIRKHVGAPEEEHSDTVTEEEWDSKEKSDEYSEPEKDEESELSEFDEDNASRLEFNESEPDE